MKHALVTLGLGIFTIVLVACEPAVVADAGMDSGSNIELCTSALTGRAVGCAAADVGLSAEICRCGSKYYWDGTSCAATAACRCTRNCDLLFDTQVACEAANTACLGDAATRD